MTPFRFDLIELAKSYGAKFSMAVVPSTLEGERVVPPPGNDPMDPKEQASGPLNGEDLAELFGIRPAVAGPGPWEVEKYVGIKRKGTSTFPHYVPPSRRGNGTSPAGTGTPGADNRPTYRPTGSVAVGNFKAPRDYDKPTCPTCGKK